MPTREEMRSLAEEIVGSYADRVATIAQLRETVKMDLKGFRDYRIATGRETRADLARSVTDCKRSTGAMLEGFSQAHSTMSKEMRAGLINGRQTLAKGERERQAEAREFIGELCQAVAEGKATVKTLLGEFDSSHNAMSKEMRAGLINGRQTLAKGERERQSDARQFKGELAKAVAEGKAATQAQLRQLAEMQAGARDEWQILTSTLQAQRVGATVAVKPAEAVAAPVEKIVEEEVAEIIPETETADIRGRTFEYLANHPDGTKLVEMEQEFGVSRIEMARLLKDFMNENKVEKRDMLYFAI